MEFKKIKRELSVFLLGLSLAFSAPGMVSPAFCAVPPPKEKLPIGNEEHYKESYAEKCTEIEQFIKEERVKRKLPLEPKVINAFSMNSVDYNMYYSVGAKYSFDGENEHKYFDLGLVVYFFTREPYPYEFVLLYDNKGKDGEDYGNVDAISFLPLKKKLEDKSFKGAFRCDMDNIEGEVLQAATELYKIGVDAYLSQIKNEKKFPKKDIDILIKVIQGSKKGEWIGKKK